MHYSQLAVFLSTFFSLILYHLSHVTLFFQPAQVLLCMSKSLFSSTVRHFKRTVRSGTCASVSALQQCEICNF